MENTAARKRKQVPEGYLIIGIDPHKKSHAAVAITQEFTTRDKFKFDNTKDLNRRKNDYRDSEVAAQLLCTGEFMLSYELPTMHIAAWLRKGPE